ncbi:AAA family ATPase [Mycolicibacterium pulveris]|uniref:LuxR family transcriptional regulator n=1 Tax=Mycolicibacterium pulveris TaxID=36813 RepID=A0A7I7UMT8_MYCPV|nr:LuxR family transcriptional regulator [Mycolicibacterium pulveris]MCV6981248.1 AAA family ATPase [Mycolicibacterium pulveris]BBY82310.1 LuxR family transcriptional regulator [Mycolicibacterium pulveris]
MPVYLAHRLAEEAAVAEFLDSASSTPSALLIEGDAGIGKTTLWMAASDRARHRGFRVLTTRAAEAESVLAYTALTDLLAEVDPTTWADLPVPQQTAVDHILSRTADSAAATDQRAVAAAFLSIIERLSDDGPLLLAVDDLPWLDPSSAYVIAYTARRLTGPVGLIATIRTEAASGDAASWLQLPRPDAIRRITLRPLSARALHQVVSDNVDRPLSRAAFTRIHQVSGGNPFYAIELARAIDENADLELPSTLAELVRVRLSGLDAETYDALLAAAALATPTVERVLAASGTDRDRLIELLEAAEQQEIIAIEGHRIRFTHPLLAAGVYSDASPERRRAMHRRLADIVAEPELRARHLALAATTGDAETLRALDDAAASAHARGAPAAAAELLNHAITLGGDTPQRRILLATHTFDAGDPAQARKLLEQAIVDLEPGPLRAQARHSLAFVRFMNDGYLEGCQLLQRALDEDAPTGRLRVSILIALAYALYMTGHPEAAWRIGEEAVTHAEPLDDPGLLSQALGVRATLQFFGGGGMDEPGMQRALELEDHDAPIPTMLRPSVERALILACSGDLDASFDQLRAVERRCVERGEEGELIFVKFYVALNRIWRADFVEADRLAKDVTGLARQLGGEFPTMLSMLLKAWLAVYDGAEDDARLAIADAIDACKVSGTAWHEDQANTALGLLEVSLGNHQAAVNTLEPLMSRHSPSSTELSAAAYLPDAVEALIESGRVTEAERFIEDLERNGHRLDRAWMLAMGARCRALVEAARGDHKAAVATAQRAIEYHDRLQMRFERARTLLVLGTLQARLRQREASVTLQEALEAFERLGTPLWAARARAWLPGGAGAPRKRRELTAVELRVAELAASGMTNRDVAGALSLSAKTVEATLARAYRKLGIRSRAELGRVMASRTNQPNRG